MKDILKNKKVLISIISILVLSILIVGGIFIFKGSDKDTKENKLLKEQTYTMYVKINPLVKLTFKETYYECTSTNDNGEEIKTICSDKEDSIMEYTLINDDAKDIYNTIDFKGKSVLDALIVLCDVARDNKVAFENLEIVSDYTFDKEELIQKIESGSKYESKINVYVDFKEYIKDDEIIKDLDKEELIKTFVVSFDSNGGSKIEKQEVKENEKATEPTKPTKTGYDFVEWQLNGKKYNFETNITSNITLTATWKKKTNQNNNNNQQKPSNGNNNQSNNNQSNNKPNEEKPKPTEPTTPTEPTKPVSSINKINLNDNILVTEITEKNMNYCYAQGWLATNFNEVFKDYLHQSIKNYAIYDNGNYLTDALINELSPNLVVDNNKENSLLNQLNNIKNSKNPNIISFNYTYDKNTHKFNYSYQYLYSSNFSKILNGNKISNILNNSIVNWTGGLCGGGDGEPPVILNETLCTKYQLTCDRW